jgi:hypothetical protein
VRVVFVATGKEREARVDTECWRDRNEGDIAILRLPDGLPEAVEVLPLGTSLGTPGHPFQTLGFRDGNERLGDGHILGLVSVGNGQQALQLRSQEVTQGYSGSPVWDEQTRRVVGMVSDIAGPDEHGRHRETAFATPSESLRAACTSLAMPEPADVPEPDRRGAGRPTLSVNWLKAFHGQQADVAGEKYRPDLHVDLPISKDLAALGLSQSTMDEFELLKQQLQKAIKHSGSPEIPDLEIEQTWQAIAEAANVAASLLEASDPFSSALERFEQLESALSHLLPLVRSLESACFRRRDAGDEGDESHAGERDASERLNEIIHRCQALRRPATVLLEWLQESSTRAAVRRLYFLIGPAGSGKTHLLLDSAESALSENRPAVVLHGSQFSGELWASICDQLGLPPLGKDALLGAMDSAASGLSGQRFVIMIDALNETPIEGYWERHLPVLRAVLAHWPNLALAVSCRDTYVELVDPSRERDKFVVETHPGFAGREIEATHKYFSHYGLEAPRIPLLTPEFSVPLFLRLYCESLADAGGTDVAVGHEGRIKIFERYLDTKVERVTRKAFTSAGSSLELHQNWRRTRAALDALLDRMASAESEWIRLDDAEAAVATIIGGNRGQALAIIGAFENEGVLSQEPSYLRREGDGIVIRVLFQAFSDFLLLRRRLDKSPDPLDDESFTIWLRDSAGWGILEAATVVFPERYDIELPDFLGLDESHLSRHPDDSEEAWQRRNRVQHVFQSLVKMLPYRSADAVTERSVQFLNVALQSDHVFVDLYDLLYTIAPQPNNRLNASGMYHHLARQTMPRRDASFGFAVYHSLSEDGSAVSRLARWAAEGPYPDYPLEVIELSATALSWLLSSANRRMRDWVTKALVQLLHGHLAAMKSLLDRFWSVNDPYVVQRVMLVTYGCLMRGGREDTEGARDLVQSVIRKFTEEPLRMDELLLDAGKGIIEWGIAHDLVAAEVRTEFVRPHGFPTLGHPLTEKRIEVKYETSYKAPRDASYSTIFNSVLGYGDFGRYVVDSKLYRFTGLLRGAPLPPEPPSEWHVDKRAARRFEKSLTPDQAQCLNDFVENTEDPDISILLDPGDQSAPVKLTTEQVRLLRAVWVPPAAAKDVSFPTDRARRWLFLRTISLGWRPELFGEEDYYLSRRDDGRSEHKAERWGKKYQWIAYHELMARLADNYQTRPDYGEERAKWDPHLRLDNLRDLDPSLPPVDYRDFAAKNDKAVSWKSSPLVLPGRVAHPIAFSSYHGDIDRFISERQAEPLAHVVALRTDANGQEWIALHSYEGMKELIGEKREWGLTQTVWLHSWFVSEDKAERQAAELLRVLEKSWEFAPPSHERGAYWGELSWMKRPESWMTADWRTIGRDNATQIPIIDTCEDYVWEGNGLDCSMEESAFAYVPSQFLMDRGSLSGTDNGPGWREGCGREVLVNTRGPHDEYPQSHPFWARRDWTQAFLRRENLALVVATWFERLSHLLVQTDQDKREIVLSAAILTAGGRFLPVGAPSRSPWRIESRTQDD